MTIFVCWLVFPLLLAVICLGCGLAVERCSRARIQPPLVLPVGFAAVVVVGLFTTLSAQTARLTLPSVLAVAALGLASSVPRTLPRIDPWAVGSAVLVFAVFAAPVVLSGEATFAGYIKLDDTATFLALVDRALEHGRSLDGLAPSSYEAALAVNLHFYPLGSLLSLGMGSALTGQDAAWLFQPLLAFLAALLALVLYQLASLVIASRPWRATAAVLGAQAALLYGYALWGGVKELAAAQLVALVAALAGTLFPSARRGLAVIPLAVATAALVGVLSIGAAVWLLPTLALAVWALLRRGDSRRPLLLAGVAAALVIPSLTVARFIFGEGVLGSLRNAGELGNLIAPLSPLQLAGVWPTGDFRLRPEDLTATYVLIAVVVFAAVVGIAVAVARRAWEIALYATSTLLAAVAFGLLGSPWLAGKAFAIASPVIVFSAVVGCSALVARGRRVEGLVALAAVALGVLWSNSLAYREVNLAPRAQLAELEQIGKDFAGGGPALMTEYEPYGVRHFLRRLDAEGASELRRRPVALRDGSTLAKGRFADLSAFRPADLHEYRTLVLRRSPVASRPPSAYRLTWSGRYYEVWQRGDAIAVGAALPCSGGATQLPVRRGPVDVRVARPGRYEIWVGGSFRGRLETLVDVRRIGSARHQLTSEGQYVSLGEVTLDPGAHTVELRQTSSWLDPGSGGPVWPIGPLVLSRADRC
ncbi:MAG TPA: hypothetical protein VJL85_05710 [Gaiellaceae bacterium]|nr:hypothetical protein [Gaiellaceae bacterium]